VSDQAPELTPEQMAQLEAELERIHVDDVILQTIVSLINLGARKGAVGAPPEAGVTADKEQLRIAIDAAKALVAQLEPRHGDKLAPFKDALSQLQMAYVQDSGQAAPGEPAAAPEPEGEPKPQSSGRLWVPGQ
jgi:hypothetical protein